MYIVLLGRTAGFGIANSLILSQISWYLLFFLKSQFLKPYFYLGNTVFMEENI